MEVDVMYILPENVFRQDGSGKAVALEPAQGTSLLIKLGITRATEDESLDVSLWGSPDQRSWKLLQVFPPKFYCGTYSLWLDLARHLDVRYLRADWRMSRWGSGEEPALFEFYLVAEEPTLQAAGAF